MSLQVGAHVRGPGQRALAISVIVHGGLGAWLAAMALHGKHVVPVPQRPVATTPHRVLAPASWADPIEVAFIEPDPAPGPVAEPKGQRIAAPRGSSATASFAATESSNVGETSSSQTRDPGGPDMMHMRGTDLELDPAAAQRIASTGVHALPKEPKATGKIESVPGGGGVIYDRVTTVEIERDGHAHFHDKKDIDVHIKLPIPHVSFEGMRKDLGKALTDWYADPNAATRFGRSQDLSNINLAAPGACDDWGSVWCDDPLAPGAEKYAREQKKTNGSLLGGAADITAWLQRKYVGDPYASRKLKLLDDTRDERVARGEVFRAEQLDRSAELIERNLARLAATRMSAVERREALFELWDECGEGEGPEGQAGQRARAQVIGWIRSHLPHGSADAFSDEEIAALDGRRASKQRFEPY